MGAHMPCQNRAKSNLELVNRRKQATAQLCAISSPLFPLMSNIDVSTGGDSLPQAWVAEQKFRGKIPRKC